LILLGLRRGQGAAVACRRQGGASGRFWAARITLCSQYMWTDRAESGRPCYDAPTSETRRRSTAGPRLDAGAGGRSPIAPPGRWPDQPSVGLLGARSRFGSGCGKAGLRQARPGMVERPIQASGPLRQPPSAARGPGVRSPPSRAFLRPQQLRSEVNRAQPGTPCSSSSNLGRKAAARLWAFGSGDGRQACPHHCLLPIPYSLWGRPITGFADPR
jgi:hypothetical protein